MALWLSYKHEIIYCRTPFKHFKKVMICFEQRLNNADNRKRNLTNSKGKFKVVITELNIAICSSEGCCIGIVRCLHFIFARQSIAQVNWHLIIPDYIDRVKYVYWRIFVGGGVVILGSLYSHSFSCSRVFQLRSCLLQQTSLLLTAFWLRALGVALVWILINKPVWLYSSVSVWAINNLVPLPL